MVNEQGWGKGWKVWVQSGSQALDESGLYYNYWCQSIGQVNLKCVGVLDWTRVKVKECQGWGLDEHGDPAKAKVYR